MLRLVDGFFWFCGMMFERVLGSGLLLLVLGSFGELFLVDVVKAEVGNSAWGVGYG